MSFKSQLATERKNLEVLEPFADKYPDLPGQPYVFNCSMNIDLRHMRATERDAALAKIGEMLGRSGWTKKANGFDASFRYKREIDGVKVLIEGAEMLSVLEGEIPVPQSAFPIMLEDREQPSAQLESATK